MITINLNEENLIKTDDFPTEYLTQLLNSTEGIKINPPNRTTLIFTVGNDEEADKLSYFLSGYLESPVEMIRVRDGYEIITSKLGLIKYVIENHLGGKYYKPEIEEFCVGFNYQLYQNRLIGWESKEFKLETDLESIDYHLSNGSIRVKYLDEQDIIDCGFNKISEEEKLITFKKANSCDGIYFYPDDRRKVLIYYDIHDYEGCIFDGYINNKKELQKILKQLRQNGTN